MYNKEIEFIFKNNKNVYSKHKNNQWIFYDTVIKINVLDLISVDETKSVKKILNTITPEMIKEIVLNLRNNEKNKDNFFYYLNYSIETNQNEEILYFWLNNLKEHLLLEEKYGILSSYLFKKNITIEKIVNIINLLEVDIKKEDFLLHLMDDYESNRRLYINKKQSKHKRSSIYQYIDYFLEQLPQDKKKEMLEKVEVFFMNKTVSEDFIYYGYLKNKNKEDMNLDCKIKILNWMSNRKLIIFKEEIDERFNDIFKDDKLILAHLFNSNHMSILEYNVSYLKNKKPDLFNNIDNFKLFLNMDYKKNDKKDFILEIFLYSIKDWKESYNILSKLEKTLNLNYKSLYSIILKKIPDSLNENISKKNYNEIKSIIEKNIVMSGIEENDNKENININRKRL